MRFLALIFLTAAALACSLKPIEEDSGSPTEQASTTYAQPTVSITAPGSGQQVAMGSDIEIQVMASGADGVDRVQLSVGGRTSSTKAFPEATTSAEALLRWRPDREGTFNLSVVAFRGLSISEPAVIQLQVVGRGDAITNPASGQPTVSESRTECNARVLISNLRIRTGPGTNFEREGYYDLNEEVIVIAQGDNQSERWLKVRRLARSEKWMLANPEWVAVTGNCDTLPVVAN
ncbi:MAG: SH3 domain-containing protein [Anaerolineae bacterium]|nr:SH3 domain-containing protein [Anaerolineae bacterium]